MSNLHEPRVVLVSNRLPVSVTLTADDVNVRPSSGGLASGLRSVHSSGKSSWIGWPGIDVPAEEDRLRVDAALAEHRVVPVHFSAEETERFYEGVANGVIWPLFHYLLDRVPASILHWEDYVRANERFADAVAAEARANDLIWIHDYHLLLLPGMLRERLPDARIGFFLHIPFPSSEVFRVLPHRESVLGGLLGADLIGFHTFNDQRHFSAALLSVLGLETEVDRIEVAGRSAQLRVLPMGADVRGFTDLASQSAVDEQSRKLRAAHEADKLVLGVDRLDYTKGLSHKFLAVERLLERNPQYRGKFRLLQIAVPSRENVSAYRELKREIEEIAGRINGAYGTLHSAPIHYVYDSVNETELAGSYRAADVMLVTPLRDGMNLVAKEYVASRVDGDGVLVLSEFAGAASELADALIANPYDVSAIAAALDRALTMPETERRARMAALREHVLARPVELWADSFLTALRGADPPASSDDLRGRTGAQRELAARLAEAPRVLFALDYDGTLVPIQPLPEAATPDPALCSLLTDLEACPGVDVAVVSGRTRSSLSEFLGRLPIALVAEHGVWSRAQGGDWTSSVDPSACSWKEPVREMLREYVARTPGALIEEKTAGMAFHYRNADRHLGAARARELRLNLVQLLSQQPVAVLGGRKVVEVRPQEVDKGTAVKRLIEHVPPHTALVAMGDDRTDEDLFRALPPEAYTFSAGPWTSHARFRLNGPSEVREFLRSFIERRQALLGNAAADSVRMETVAS
jgi:trehalose 6-phosphate synthase/phosphatase